MQELPPSASTDMEHWVTVCQEALARSESVAQTIRLEVAAHINGLSLRVADQYCPEVVRRTTDHLQRYSELRKRVIGNIGDLDNDPRGADCLKQLDVVLDRVKDISISYRKMVDARREVEPSFIDWILKERRSVLDRPYTTDDHEQILRFFSDTKEKVDNAVDTFEYTDHNVLKALDPITEAVDKLCNLIERYSEFFSPLEDIARIVDPENS